MPIAYWASDNVITDFAQGKLTNDVADAKQGLATGNNNKFLRYWFEVEFNKIKFDAKTLEDAKKSRKNGFLQLKVVVLENGMETMNTWLTGRMMEMK